MFCNLLQYDTRAVVENYKPQIKIDPNWEMVKLGDVCDFKRGPFGGSLKKDIFVKNGYAVYEQSHETKVLDSRFFAPLRMTKFSLLSCP